MRLAVQRTVRGGPVAVVLTLGVTLGMMHGGASRARAQGLPARWNAAPEIGVVFPTTWITGAPGPTVSGNTGLQLGIGVTRVFPNAQRAGVLARFATQSLTVKEAGSSRSASSVRQLEVAATASTPVRKGTRLQLSLEASAGVSTQIGAPDIIPFRDTGRVMPLGELGLALARVARPSRRQLSLVLRHGAIRVGAGDRGSIVAAGWVQRTTASIRITR